jgi:hypothetical protein
MVERDFSIVLSMPSMENIRATTMYIDQVVHIRGPCVSVGYSYGNCHNVGPLVSQ